MSLVIATVIRCADAARLVFNTATSVERQTTPSMDIVIVTDDSTPPGIRNWLAGVSEVRGWRPLHVPGVSPGAAWNAGFQATTADVVTCLDAGDLLEPHHNAVLLSVLTRSDAALATSAILQRGPGSAVRVLPPPAADSRWISSMDASHSTWTIRRSAWRAVAGFDEALPTLADYDFCLRTNAANGRVAVIDEPLVIRPWRRDGLYRRALQSQHDEAVAKIVERHHAALAAELGAVLYEGQRSRARMRLRNRDLLERRRAGIAELERLRARSDELRRELPESDQWAVDLGDLRRVSPISRDWGYERGAPVDRHYVEEFLARHAADVAGVVLEVQEPDYTQRFGGVRVTHSDVLDLDPSNTRATIVADLRCAPNIPADTYDCIILTQTLHVIDDMEAVIVECARILKPGGVLLATLPCASRVSVEYGYDGDFWRVTDAGARRLFGAAFPASHLNIESRGNVLVNTAFLYGLGGQELTPAEYDATDPYFPALVTVRARKPVSAQFSSASTHRAHASRSRPALGHSGAAVLMYHRVASPDTDVHHLVVSPAEFREQMAYLREHYEPVSLADLAHAIRTGTLRPGTIGVTFDDGYLDNIENASPVLSELGVPATFFMTTERLNEAYEYWWDTLEAILLTPDATLPGECVIDLPDGRRRLPTASPADRLAAYWDIYRAIVSVTAEVRDGVVAALRAWSGRTMAGMSARRMTPREIVALSSRPGHDVGAHSARHLMLPGQPADVQRAELEQSKLSLESVLGRTVDTFAYPFGAWDQQTREVVRACGFRVAVACDDAAIPHKPDLLTLPRLDVAGRGDERFADWLRRRVGPPRARPAVSTSPASPSSPTTPS